MAYDLLFVVGLLVSVMHHSQPDSVFEFFASGGSGSVRPNHLVVSQEVMGACAEEFEGTYFSSVSRREEMGWRCNANDLNATLEWAVSCIGSELGPRKEVRHLVDSQILQMAYSEMYSALHTHRKQLTARSSDVAMQRSVDVMEVLLENAKFAAQLETPEGYQERATCLHKYLWTKGPLKNVMEKTH